MSNSLVHFDDLGMCFSDCLSLVKSLFRALLTQSLSS